MFIIILSAEDVIEAKLHMGIVLLLVYVIFGTMVYIVCSRLLKLFRKENKDLILALFPENYVRLKKLISMFILH